ncbi:MAG TPA: CRISPR-associated endonuclease Cas2 [Fibrobacteria bacterium]|nr:CRISPR-associated endonuclease Cas2 [Fibrobacteria bacterium]HOX50226.1 CRISPR-associated endonuclease Cas2 [Fibrobacteria bacterium]
MSRRRFLVAWDVADSKRLRAVRRCAEDFGHPLQKSVFLCDLKREEAARFRLRLGKILKPSQDQVVFLDLGPDQRDPADYLTVLGLAVSLPERIVVV